MALAPLPAINEPFVDGTNKVTPKWRAYLQRIEQNLAALETADAGLSTTYIAKALLTTRGDVIYRDASAPARLAKGTSGQVLTMGADDPAWAAPSFTLISSGNLPSANLLAFTSITAKKLLLKVSGASCATATRYLQLKLSIDNGSSYALTYTGFSGGTGTVVDAVYSTTNVLPTITTETAAGTSSFTVEISTQGGICSGVFYSTAVATPRPFFAVLDAVPASAVNAMELIWNSTGNFDAGTYELYGL